MVEKHNIAMIDYQKRFYTNRFRLKHFVHSAIHPSLKDEVAPGASLFREFCPL